MYPIGKTDELQIHLLEVRYAEALFRLTDKNRLYLREWLPWVDAARSIRDTRRFIENAMALTLENNGFQAAIFYEGKLAGSIGTNRMDWHNMLTSIGYWLGAEYQGKGIMTRACQAVVDYLVDELKLNRVEIRAATGNWKSRAIPERLGFVKEGTIRQAEWLYDHYVDHVVYGMLAKDWKSARR